MTDLELEVWQRVAGLAQSPSHDFHHIRRVQAYADELGQALGVETNLVRLAAILHDLGRGDEKRRHGLSSIEASREMAEEVLRHLDLPDDARRTVIDAIESHDQPDVNPEAPAAKILKDADFLAGFGAWGVLRIAMWSGETGRRLDDVINALSSGMQRRLHALEYSESRDAALREFLFARQFQAELDRPVCVGTPALPGFYCVLEGISGVGKNTIARAICDDLKASAIPHVLVEEPGETYRRLRRQLPEGVSEDFPPLRKALLIADRAEQFTRIVQPSLAKGDVVVSVRSCLSTAVYQSTDRAEAYRTLLEHEWLPPCDLLLLLDTDVDRALNRIQSREKPAGDFESAVQLAHHRQLYRELAVSFRSRCTKIIDASGAQTDVATEALSHLHRELSQRKSAA